VPWPPPLSPGRTASTWSVSIQGFSFDPPVLTVDVGDTVVWTNGDAVTRTTTSDPGQVESWSSVGLPRGGSFSVTFESSGNFSCHCSVHPSMRGTVTVRQAMPGFLAWLVPTTLGLATLLAMTVERKLRA